MFVHKDTFPFILGALREHNIHSKESRMARIEEELRKDPKAIHVKDSLGKPLLCIAVYEIPDVDIVRTLLLADANVNQHGESSTAYHTPLHYAVLFDHADITELLLSANAKVDVYNYNRETPLDIAFKKNDLVNARLLLGAGGNPFSTNGSSQNFFNPQSNLPKETRLFFEDAKKYYREKFAEFKATQIPSMLCFLSFNTCGDPKKDKNSSVYCALYKNELFDRNILRIIIAYLFLTEEFSDHTWQGVYQIVARNCAEKIEAYEKAHQFASCQDNYDAVNKLDGKNSAFGLTHSMDFLIFNHVKGQRLYQLTQEIHALKQYVNRFRYYNYRH